MFSFQNLKDSVFECLAAFALSCESSIRISPAGGFTKASAAVSWL
jgi:hypothetical protein